MEKNRIFNPFGICMTVGIVLCSIVEAVLAYDGSFGAMQAMAMAAAILGVMNCVLCSDASIWNYLFGIPAVIFQGIVALNAGNIGVGWMDIALLVPMQVAGFFLWVRRGANLSAQADEAQVKVRRLTPYQRIALLFGIGVCLMCLSPVLKHFNATAPWIDAAAVVLQLVAQVLMILAFMEQWVLWIVVNGTYLLLWVVSALQDKPGSVLMIVMWSFYLIISIHGLRVWYRISK